MSAHASMNRNETVEQPNRSRVERVLEGVVRGWKHHTDPVNHQPIYVEPVTHPVKRTLVAFAGVGALGLAGVGVVTPIMPTWPFALVALFCFARSSSRVRNWVVDNHVIKSVMSLVRTRQERPFVWTHACLNGLMGGKKEVQVEPPVVERSRS